MNVKIDDSIENKIEINRYLYYKFGHDGVEDEVSESWPFELNMRKCFQKIQPNSSFRA